MKSCFGSVKHNVTLTNCRLFCWGLGKIVLDFQGLLYDKTWFIAFVPILVMNSYGATWFRDEEMAVLPLCCFFSFLLICFCAEDVTKTAHSPPTRHHTSQRQNKKFYLKQLNKKQRPSSIQTPQLCISPLMDQTLGVQCKQSQSPSSPLNQTGAWMAEGGWWLC